MNKKQKSSTRLFPHPEIVDNLHKKLLKTGGLKIVGFGMFNLKRMKGIKNGVHPYSGKRQNFPPYTKISFKPVKKLKESIQSWK